MVKRDMLSINISAYVFIVLPGSFYTEDFDERKRATAMATNNSRRSFFWIDPAHEQPPIPLAWFFLLDLTISYFFFGLGVYNLLMLAGSQPFDLTMVGALAILFCWLRLEDGRVLRYMPRKVQGLFILVLWGVCLLAHWSLGIFTSLLLTPISPAFPWLYLVIFMSYVVFVLGGDVRRSQMINA